MNRGFDPADSSLLKYVEIKGCRLISDDHPMILKGVTTKKNVFQLVDYFAELLTVGFVTKREFYHLVKILRGMKNISKKKESRLLVA